MTLFMVLNFFTIPNVSSYKIKAIYGFSKSLPNFKGKSNKQIINILKSWHIDAIFGGFEDKEFVSDLHNSGIKIFEEVGFFVSEKFWKKYPKSRPITKLGEFLPKEEWYAGVNPIIDEIQNEVFAKIKKLIMESDIDGIWLDFIRWPCHWESHSPKLEQTSFDEFTVKKFLTENHINLPAHIKNSIERNQWILDNYLTEWTNWKCLQITSIVKQVRQITKDAPRKILIGLFGVPWHEDDFDGAIKRIIGQDYKELAKYVDIFSPMVYHVMCGKDVKWIGEITGWVHHQTGRSVLPIIQSIDFPNTLQSQEFGRAINIGLQAEGSCGIIIFNIKGLSNDKLEIMKYYFMQ